MGFGQNNGSRNALRLKTMKRALHNGRTGQLGRLDHHGSDSIDVGQN